MDSGELHHALAETHQHATDSPPPHNVYQPAALVTSAHSGPHYPYESLLLAQPKLARAAGITSSDQARMSDTVATVMEHIRFTTSVVPGTNEQYDRASAALSWLRSAYASGIAVVPARVRDATGSGIKDAEAYSWIADRIRESQKASFPPDPAMAKIASELDDLARAMIADSHPGVSVEGGDRNREESHAFATRSKGQRPGLDVLQRSQSASQPVRGVPGQGSLLVIGSGTDVIDFFDLSYLELRDFASLKVMHPIQPNKIGVHDTLLLHTLFFSLLMRMRNGNYGDAGNVRRKAVEQSLGSIGKELLSHDWDLRAYLPRSGTEFHADPDTQEVSSLSSASNVELRWPFHIGSGTITIESLILGNGRELHIRLPLTEGDLDHELGEELVTWLRDRLTEQNDNVTVGQLRDPSAATQFEARAQSISVTDIWLASVKSEGDFTDAWITVTARAMRSRRERIAPTASQKLKDVHTSASICDLGAGTTSTGEAIGNRPSTLQLSSPLRDPATPGPKTDIPTRFCTNEKATVQTDDHGPNSHQHVELEKSKLIQLQARLRGLAYSPLPSRSASYIRPPFSHAPSSEFLAAFQTTELAQPLPALRKAMEETNTSPQQFPLGSEDVVAGSDSTDNLSVTAETSSDTFALTEEARLDEDMGRHVVVPQVAAELGLREGAAVG